MGPDADLDCAQMTAGIYVARTFLNPILSNLADPEKEKQEQAKSQARAHLERLNRRQRDYDDPDGDTSSSRRGRRVEELPLNEYESLIAMEMVAPEDIPVGFDGELVHYGRSASGGERRTMLTGDRYRRARDNH